MKVIVAGVGNVLRADDGFGVVVAERLQEESPPHGVTVIDVGIGGIHLVQELMGIVDALVVIDAVDLGRQPGSVFVVKPEIKDVATLTQVERLDELADMHYATPERALMLANGLGVLPTTTWIVGCQPEDARSLGEGLSPAVEGAIPVAIREVKKVVSGCGVEWPWVRS